MSRFEDLALAVRDAIKYCCYDEERNIVDLSNRKLNENEGYFYVVLAHYLKEYGFIKKGDFDETLGVRIAFDKLKKHARERNLRLLIEDLMLNPELCGFFCDQLEEYNWVYKK